jgi:hypothetical protein
MHRGYVKLWRKTLDSGLIKNHNVWIFWTWCLLKANHRHEKTQVVGYQEVTLNPGEFVFGRKAASIETGLSEQTIRTCINFLKNSKNLTIKPTNKFSIISITNWDTYQQTEEQNNQQSNTQLTSSQPTTNQQVTTNKNEKNDKNEKNVKKCIGKNSKFSPPAVEQVIQFFLDNGFSESSARKAFSYYQDGDWKDSRGTQVRNWKQKMRGVWFKDENRLNGASAKLDKHNDFSERVYVGTPIEDIPWVTNDAD